MSIVPRPVVWLALAACAALASTRVAAQRTPQTAEARAIKRFVDSLARDPNGLTIPTSAVQAGARTVAAKDHVTGDIVAWKGPLEVFGTVDGNAVAVGGDVIIHQGGTVRGSAVSVGGNVRADGGTVGGEMRTLSALSGERAGMSRTPAQATKRSLSLAIAWYIVLALIGLAVASFARSNLEVVADVIHADFSRSFLFGVLGQIGLAPALVLGIIALAITLLGIIVIPFFAVAFVLASVGALALGFIAMAYVIGEAAVRRRSDAVPSDASPVLRYLFVGLTLFFALWVICGALAWAGAVGTAVRLIAAAITWAAVTVGFGATLLSRAGTKTPPAAPPRPLTVTEEYAWQTPTPVSGVAAARRPTPAPRPREP